MVREGLIGVNRACRLFKIAKDTYYQAQDPQSSLEQRYRKLKPKLVKIIEDNPAYGYPRIKKALKEQYGEVVNHKLLLKLLKLWGLTLKRKIRPKKKGWIKRVLDFLGKRANLLFGLSIDRIFQVVVSDITEIPYCQGRKKAYLCVHLDYLGKMILGWQLEKHPNTSLISASFRLAKNRLRRLGRFPKGIIFHQDQGSVYTSAEYTTTILKAGGILSFSRKGEPGDNAVNESFFSRLKEERREVFFEAKDYWELEVLLKRAIDYYNFERYHTSIGTVPPWEFTKKALG